VNLAVVIPSIREDCALKWIREWSDDLKDVRVILVEDNPEKTFTLPGRVEHYSWRDIDSDLGDDSWIIARRNSGCRSYGFLKALEGGADLIWTLDDDCYPEEALRGTYLKYWDAFYRAPEVPDDSWWNTTDHMGIYPRGYPYKIRENTRKMVLHHGLWSEIPDLDGITQLANPDLRFPPAGVLEVIPSGKMFPMCIMNVVFRREITPVMYQLLMGKDEKENPWGFDRFDDIWAGMFMKRTVDHLNLAVTSGAPSIRHSRASDPRKNVEKEAAGMAVHENFWKYIQDIWFNNATTPSECYSELADAVGAYSLTGNRLRPEYWQELALAMRLWTDHVERVM